MARNSDYGLDRQAVSVVVPMQSHRSTYLMPPTLPFPTDSEIHASTRPKEATGHIMVLRAGKPAPWNIRLAMILRGNSTRRITRG